MPNEPKNDGVRLLLADLTEKEFGGAQWYSLSIRQTLQSLYSDLLIFQISYGDMPKLRRLVLAFRGIIRGLDDEKIAKVSDLIEEKKVTKVILDGSGYGYACKKIRQAHQDMEIFVLSHNCESKFFYESFRHKKRVFSFLLFLFVHLAEKMTCKYADRVICLTKEDCQDFVAFHNCHNTSVLPIFLDETIDRDEQMPEVKSPYCLFVGSSKNFANIQGIRWFVEQVSPHIGLHTVIVGQGMDEFAAELSSDMVSVVGRVPSLMAYYEHADVVVAPLFEGSGMKTKVAEALKFGSRVIGTPHAFQGYSAIPESIATVAETPGEFITAIDSITNEMPPEDRLLAREIFLNNYSTSSVKNKLVQLLQV